MVQKLNDTNALPTQRTTMSIKESITVNTGPEKIFALYQNVSNWSSWDPDLKESAIDGAFVSGTTGTVVPKSGPKSKVLFTDVVANKGFAVECKLPLCLMRFEHELVPQGAQTQVTHRVLFTGLMAWFFSRVIGSGMKKTLPHTLKQLKAVAEA
jgi:hypothetical protein